MEKKGLPIKDAIIISILNELGIGVNAYVPRSPLIIVNMMRKLLPSMDIVASKATDDADMAISIDDKLLLKYKLNISKTRIIQVDLVEI